jgi:hypothetical protein
MIEKEYKDKKTTIYRTSTKKQDLLDVVKDVLEVHRTNKKVVLSVKVL